MNTYKIDGQIIDSIELKCLVVSRGLKVKKEAYRKFSETCRLDMNPLTCNCMILSDGTIVQLTDMGFHLKYLNGSLSWDNLKLLRYASELGTDFSLGVAEIVRYAMENTGANSVQITGGSTFSGTAEEAHLTAYLKALQKVNIPGEILLYITPPEDRNAIDRYFQLGADRIACSLEVWDETKASAGINEGSRNQLLSQSERAVCGALSEVQAGTGSLPRAQRLH